MNLKGHADFERWRKNILKYADDIEKLKNKLALQGEINIRKAFENRGFSNITGKTAKIGLSSKINEDSITFISKSVYSEYLENGVRRHVMRYLLNSKKPIPIPIQMKDGKKNKKGKKFNFVQCTEQSIARGKWVHKGIKKDRQVNDGMGFMEAGIDKTLRDANKEIESLKKLIRR